MVSPLPSGVEADPERSLVFTVLRITSSSSSGGAVHFDVRGQRAAMFLDRATHGLAQSGSEFELS